jgi:D-glycero-alpha-D-manno-heptose-7-phosphate kinase
MSFCGGGSDLPSFYTKHGGCVIGTSINKYMYICVHPYFNPQQTLLKYSKTELVSNVHEIEHKIFNCVLNDMRVEGVEIASIADIPSGTGLGSSSAFTVGLLHTLSCYQGQYRSKLWLADKACHIEIEMLGNPIGKQDQYAAALGGFNFIRFNQDDTVSYEPVMMSAETNRTLQQNLVMFYLGETRSANTILAEQKKMLDDERGVKSTLEMCALAQEMKTTLERNDLSNFGALLNENWRLKQTLAAGITNPEINELYEKALNAGASGGKLLGAGGGGFLLFYCEREKQERLRLTLGLKPTPFSFEREGTSVVYIGDEYWKSG